MMFAVDEWLCLRFLFTLQIWVHILIVATYIITIVFPVGIDFFTSCKSEGCIVHLCLSAYTLQFGLMKFIISLFSYIRCDF